MSLVQSYLEVGVCGAGRYLDELTDHLKTWPGMRVRRLENKLADSVPELSLLAPQVIVYEMNAAEPQFVETILQANPAVALVGITERQQTVLTFLTDSRWQQEIAALAQTIEAWGIERNNLHGGVRNG